MPNPSFGFRRRALPLACALALSTFLSVGRVPADAPLVLEDFDSLTTITGSAGATAIPNDLGNNYYLVAATSGAGFEAVSSFGQSGPNQAMRYNSRTETGFLIHDELDYSGFSGNRHQLAIRFRYSGTDAAASNRGPLIAVYQSGASFPAYVLRVGRNSAGTLGISPTVTTGAGPAYGSFNGLAAAENTWHTLVVQYDNATDATSNTAAMRMWLNPVTGTDAPAFNVASGTFGTQTGPGPIANFGLAGSFFSGNAGRPTEITIDTVAFWDGNGTSGVNDLQAALDHFSATVPVELSGFTLD